MRQRQNITALKKRPHGQPERPRIRYCSIGFQPVSSVHWTAARQASPFVPMVNNTQSSVLELLKGLGETLLFGSMLPVIRPAGDFGNHVLAVHLPTSLDCVLLPPQTQGPFRDSAAVINPALKRRAKSLSPSGARFQLNISVTG